MLLELVFNRLAAIGKWLMSKIELIVREINILGNFLFSRFSRSAAVSVNSLLRPPVSEWMFLSSAFCY